ncbi:hypothetical protein [Nocardia sp. NPDC127526]|uniref:hypothetical protein n=1 Tax=Nocardia sp. NPDC127526 TaxID=3345393 RepID=UPI0036261439
MSATAAEAAQIARKLNLVLDLDEESYPAVRAEFFDMTRAAKKRSGLTLDEIAARANGLFQRTTAANYAGGSGYDCWPSTNHLEVFLRICGFSPTHVQVAVNRMTEIQRRWPNGRAILRELAPESLRSRFALHHVGIHVPSPGENALKVALKLVKTRADPDGISGPALVSMAFAFEDFPRRGEYLPATLRGQARMGEAVNGKLRRGDIVVLSRSRSSGFYLGASTVLTGNADNPEVKLVQKGTAETDGTDVPEAVRRFCWPSAPLPAPPGIQALEAAGTIRSTTPFDGSQTDFVRALFANIGVALPSNTFEMPVVSFPEKRLRPYLGDIIFTTGGNVGVYAGPRQLLYLGPDRWPTTLAIGPKEYVAARRVLSRPGSQPPVALLDVPGIREAHEIFVPQRIVELSETRESRLREAAELATWGAAHRAEEELARIFAQVIYRVQEAEARQIRPGTSAKEFRDAAKQRVAHRILDIAEARQARYPLLHSTRVPNIVFSPTEPLPVGDSVPLRTRGWIDHARIPPHA